MEDWNVTRLSTLVTSSQEQTEETEVFKKILRYLGYLLLKFVSVITGSPPVDRLNQTRSFVAMHFDGRADDNLR